MTTVWFGSTSLPNNASCLSRMSIIQNERNNRDTPSKAPVKIRDDSNYTACDDSSWSSWSLCGTQLPAIKRTVLSLVQAFFMIKIGHISRTAVGILSPKVK